MAFLTDQPFLSLVQEDSMLVVVEEEIIQTYLLHQTLKLMVDKVVVVMVLMTMVLMELLHPLMAVVEEEMKQNLQEQLLVLDIKV